MNYLGHNRNYVLLLILVLAVILCILWALFRNKEDCKDGDCSDSYYNSESKSHSDDRYTKDSQSSADKYSSDSYSESYNSGEH